MGEYSEVEEDDGEFGKGDKELVDDLTSIPELRNLLVLISRRARQ